MTVSISCAVRSALWIHLLPVFFSVLLKAKQNKNKKKTTMFPWQLRATLKQCVSTVSTVPACVFSLLHPLTCIYHGNDRNLRGDAPQMLFAK